jgi:hypothetical protein
MTGFPTLLYTYEFSDGKVSCHAYSEPDPKSAQADGEKLKAAFSPAPNDPTAQFNYSVVPLSGEGPWVVFSSVSGFGLPNQNAVAYEDELAAYKAALEFAAPGGVCRIDGATLMVLQLEALPA